MSGRDPFGGDPDDLDVRARRGLLSRSEQRDLSRLLEANPTLRVAYQVGRDMDGATAVRGGDDALIARAAMRATGEAVAAGGAAQPAASKRRWISAAAIALGVLSASGMAAALWSGALAWPFANAPEAAPVQPRPQASVRRAVPAPVPAPSRVATPNVAARSAEAAPLPAAEANETAAPRARRDRAAELFRAANAARRNGEFTRAARLYAELRDAYPDSDEGGVARVSLGQLLLARGNATDAAREFGRYLARGRGPLLEEALLGQAQSFQQIGRERAERASLQRLITDFPNSVYAAQARTRLAALERGAATSAP